MRNEEAIRTVWLLYQPPMEKARTGHAGLLITQKIDNGVKAIYYFSLYHALLPSEVRKMSWGQRFSTSIPATTISSYEDDVVMRGQSWVRMVDENKREDEAVQHLIANLTTDSSLREKYFNRGAYQYAIRLPASINVDVVMTELERIKNTVWWAMVGPITRSLYLDPVAYNCCSAIDSALQKGMQKPYQKGATGDLIEVTKKVLSFTYFMAILFSPDVAFSAENPATALWFVPAIYLVLQAVREAFSFVFMNNLNATPLGKIDKNKACLLSAIFSVMNVVTMPFVTRATDALIYPTSLAKKVEKKYGGEVFNAGLVDLPRLEGW